jgi:hypothetical protein
MKLVCESNPCTDLEIGVNVEIITAVCEEFRLIFLSSSLGAENKLIKNQFSP